MVNTSACRLRLPAAQKPWKPAAQIYQRPRRKSANLAAVIFHTHKPFAQELASFDNPLDILSHSLKLDEAARRLDPQEFLRKENPHNTDPTGECIKPGFSRLRMMRDFGSTLKEF